MRHKFRRRSLQLPAQTISGNCVSVLFADGEPYLRLFFVTFAKQQHKFFVRNAFAMFVNIRILKVFFQSKARFQFRSPITVCSTNAIRSGNAFTDSSFTRKFCDDRGFFFSEECGVLRLFSFLRGIRVPCFFDAFWVGRFFSFFFSLIQAHFCA